MRSDGRVGVDWREERGAEAWLGERPAIVEGFWVCEVIHRPKIRLDTGVALRMSVQSSTTVLQLLRTGKSGSDSIAEGLHRGRVVGGGL